MVYLFIGEDIVDEGGVSKKETALNNIKKTHLAQGTKDFNYDIIYAREASLKYLQEKLLFLPLESKQRIIIIKSAQDLKEECRDFILENLVKLDKQLILVFDVVNAKRGDLLVAQLLRSAKVMRFKEVRGVDTFGLARSIDSRRTDLSLRILNQILEEGERPERILGGLRYNWERQSLPVLQSRKRLKLLLNCDLEIKTGKLKPDFALEKLVISLCSLG
ncbi:MAG: hypothetical protein HY761_10365 [Candidatus Omnitrophica bacterium]|nr:hypothetical protein [Candidatus Omnitrophota bacterium]